MEELFEFDGQEYTLAEVQKAAEAKSLNIDDYIKEYNISRKSGKTTPTTPGAVVEETAAPKIKNLEFKSATSLLEYPGAKIEYINPLTDPEADKYEIIKNRYFINTADLIKGAKTIAQEQANKEYLNYLPKKFDKGYFTKEEKEAYEKYKETGNIDSSLLKDAYVRPINPETLKPYTGLEMTENILEDFWPGLKMQFKGLQSMGLEFISKTAGKDAADFLLGDIDIDAKIVKKDNKYFYEKEGIIKNEIGATVNKKQKELFEDYIQLQNAMQYKGSISEGFKSGDLTATIAGIGNAFSGAVQTMGPAYFTAGYSLYPQIAGTMFMDFNIAKAKALYKNDPNSFNKLIDNEQLDFKIPASLALLSSVSEKIGFDKITEAIKKSQFVGQFLVKTLWAGGTEAGTGYAQFLIEETNNNLGKQMPILKALEETSKVAFSPEALEATLQEAFGGIGISIAGKGIKAVAGIRADVYPDIEDDISKLSDLKQKYKNAKDDIVAEGIQNQITELEKKIKNSMIRANGIFLNSSEKELSDINNLVDLKQKQIERTKKLIEAKDKGEISEQDYLDALEGYKQSFIAAKNKISGITQNISENANKSAQNVEKIYQEKGKNGIAEIIELYRPMAEKLAMKRRNVPGFDKELLTDEILTGKRGILDLINEYNPTENPGITLPMYVNKFAAARAIEASQRILKTDFEIDVTEAKGVTEETTPETRIEIQEEAQQKIRKALAEDLNLSEDTQNEIVTAVQKTLGTKLPAVTDKKFKQALTTGFRNELTNTFKSIFGRTAAYEQFLRDNFEKIYSAIPQETINKNFPEFNEAIIDPKTGKQLRERTAEGKKIFQKKDISKAEFLKYFLNAPGNVKGARKTSLAKVLADEIGLDNVLTSLSKPEILEKFKAIQEIQGQEIPSNFRVIISKAINRIDNLIEALDNFEKDKSILKSDFGLTIPAIKVLKLFLNGIKVGLKAGLTIEKAISNALKDIEKNSIKEELPIQEQKIIKNVISEIPANDFISLNTKEILERLNNNYELKVKDAQKKSINEFLVPYYKNKIKSITSKIEKEILAQEFYNNWNRALQRKSITGYSQKEVIKLIKNIFGEDIKINTKQLVDQSQTSRFAKYFINDKENFKIKQHIQADNNFKNIINLLEELKNIYSENSSNIDNIYFLLSLAGIDMNSIGKAWQQLGNNYDNIELAKKNPQVTLEHNPPYDWTLKNIFIPYITNDINSKTTLIDILKSHKLEIISKEAAQKLNDPNGLDLQVKMPKGYKITDNPIIRLLKVYPKLKTPSKKIRIFDFDDTLAESKSNVLYTMPNGKKGKLNAEQFAKQGDDLAKQGAKFDFSEFSKVIDGEKGPLFDVAKKIIEARGSENIYILTARPENAKYAIKQFLDALGLPFNIDNIVGLGNGSPQAKADWIKNKVKEGFNDVYFADDAVKNVQAVKDALKDEDIKSRIQQAKKQAKSLDRQFNENILQKSTGIEWYKEYSPVKAKLLGKGKGKKFFIPYSADDFVGLLYTTLGKGEIGDAQMEWYEENLLRPFSRGIQQYEAAKQKALREWMAIKKEATKNVPGGLNKVNDTGFRNQDAVRIYIWNKQGNEIEGLSNADLNENLKIIKNNSKLKEFADRLITLQPEGYPPASKNWLSGDITTDLVAYINDVKRGEFLTEWKENVDIIFSDKNKNKLRALYGDRYVEALENILHRMRTGSNRYSGSDRTTKRFMDWTNNSVGTIMFFNARSAVLQTLSAVNFINFSDNNPINAGLAFANQKQYWADFSALWNSDFLKQRRSGLQTDINADEIARAAEGAENKTQAVLSYLLKIGFIPTQAADSFAIATGGASFYRNRIKKYVKEGLSQEEAQKKAFTDFQEIAEETQQSARPDRISAQQASPLGRLILAFGNTPMQYARLTKKAALDLINGRGDWKTNISKIAYYSVIQNIIFSALQQGLFALLFSDEEDDEEKERYFKLGNGMADTLLRGMGVYGAAAATVKNMILEVIKQEQSKRPDYTQVAIQSTSISPPINSKLRKLISAGKTFTYKQSREKVFTEGFSLENPAFLAAGQVLSAGINLPADRMVTKLDHLKTAMEPETELWQSIALSLGWSEWDLGIIKKETKKESNLKIKPFKNKGFKTKKFKTK